MTCKGLIKAKRKYFYNDLTRYKPLDIKRLQGFYSLNNNERGIT